MKKIAKGEGKSKRFRTTRRMVVFFHWLAPKGPSLEEGALIEDAPVPDRYTGKVFKVFNILEGLFSDGRDAAGERIFIPKWRITQVLKEET